MGVVWVSRWEAAVAQLTRRSRSVEAETSIQYWSFISRTRSLGAPVAPVI